IATPTPITTAAPVTRITAAAKGKQPAKAKSLSDLSKAARTEVEQLKIVLRRSRQETHISQHGGSSTDKGTGSKPGVLDVPSDELEEEISWNSSDDEDVDAQDEGDKNDESDDGNDDDNDETVKDGSKRDDDDDDNDDEEELAKIDEPEDTRGGDEVIESEGESDEEETRQKEEESFDPIPRTPEGSEDEGNDEEDQDLRLSEEARIQEEEEADELYRDGKQPAKAKSSSDLSKAARTEAKQLKNVLRRSRQETHISQHGGSSTDEGTGSKPGVSDVPSDESEEEISWNSSDDEDVDAQ
nr:hypothetical protein [Tanacetum cinerariifolium]